jgi:hypothetical protein
LRLALEASDEFRVSSQGWVQYFDGTFHIENSILSAVYRTVAPAPKLLKQ